jgi:hypothetical protein
MTDRPRLFPICTGNNAFVRCVFFRIAFPAGDNFVVVCWSISNNCRQRFKAFPIDRDEPSVTFDPFSLGTDFCLQSEAGAGQSFAFGFRIQNSGFRIIRFFPILNLES